MVKRPERCEQIDGQQLCRTIHEIPSGQEATFLRRPLNNNTSSRVHSTDDKHRHSAGGTGGMAGIDIALKLEANWVFRWETFPWEY